MTFLRRRSSSTSRRMRVLEGHLPALEEGYELVARRPVRAEHVRVRPVLRERSLELGYPRLRSLDLSFERLELGRRPSRGARCCRARGLRLWRLFTRRGRRGALALEIGPAAVVRTEGALL